MRRFPNTNFKTGRICLFALIAAIAAFSSPAAGADDIDVGITSYNQHDTLWATWPSTFDVYIANSEEMCGFSLGHQFWSPDGASWHWLDVGGWGYSGIISTNLESRWGDMTCYDLSTNLVTEQNIDEIGRDSIMMGAAGLVSCCPSGPLELMYSYNLKLDDPGGNDALTMCIDSCFIPPSGAFVFYNYMGNAYPPAVLWPEGGACWPVKKFPYVCGDANFDGEVNVGDVVYIISFVFAGGPTPYPYCQADVNNAGWVEVGDAVYLINYIFKQGPPPVPGCCP